MISVSVWNKSTVIAGADIPQVMAALQKQVKEHFLPWWGIDAELIPVPSGVSPNPRNWILSILDDSTQADALGFHETTSNGLPLGKVFARTSQQDGENWTVTASHELLEMLADPWICDTVLVQTSDTAGTLYPREVCDVCEGTTYEIDGVAVSNFVLPSYWFPAIAGVTPAGPFDYLGQLTAPLPALLPGGYLGEMAVGTGTWQQIADMRRLSARHAVQPGSRRHRRTLPRKDWRVSAP